jgi:hypothetical protein
MACAASDTLSIGDVRSNTGHVRLCASPGTCYQVARARPATALPTFVVRPRQASHAPAPTICCRLMAGYRRRKAARWLRGLKRGKFQSMDSGSPVRHVWLCVLQSVVISGVVQRSRSYILSPTSLPTCTQHDVAISPLGSPRPRGPHLISVFLDPKTTQQSHICRRIETSGTAMLRSVTTTHFPSSSLVPSG